MSKKSRYSETELAEFKVLIQNKIDLADVELKENMAQLQQKNSIKFRL